MTNQNQTEKAKVVYAEPVVEEGNPFSDFFKRVYAGFKTIAYLAIVLIAFYGGMYVMMDHRDNNNATKETLVAAITDAVTDTSEIPIIQIVPNKSLLEKVKYNTFWDEPEREVITLTHARAAELLYGENDPGMIASAWYSTIEFSGKAWEKTKSSGSWAWDKVKFWD